MKKRSMILLLGAVFALTGCSTNGNNNNSNNQKETVLNGITLSSTSLTLAITSDTPTPTSTLTVSVDPSSYSTSGLTWASSDASVATVSNGVVTGLKAGTSTITATLGEKKATCAVTVTKDPFDNIIEKTVDDFGKEDLNQNLYRVSGVVQNINSVSHSFRLYKSDGSGTYITVTSVGYESTREDDFTFTDNLITYNSPDVFENLDIEEGNYATLVGIYYYYANAYEFKGYLDDMNDGKSITYTPTITVNDATYGTASLSVASGTYGTEVEVIASANDGYALSTITYNDTPLAQNDAGKYVFNISACNFVAVSFVESTSTTVTFDFTAADAAASTAQYVGTQNNASSAPKIISPSSGKAFLRLDKESANTGAGASLDTIADLGGNIVKVSVSAYSNKAAGTTMAVYGTNDAYTDSESTRTWNMIGNDITVAGKDESALATYEVEVTTAYKYIRIQNVDVTTTAAQLRITSVTIEAK